MDCVDKMVFELNKNIKKNKKGPGENMTVLFDNTTIGQHSQLG